ncbi:hypothetical protein ACLHDG_05770 [Sulfurovum sp. CS9]|uniref:hypothetical protein n=1 Tax=Sulfurovum sp. CS9 TaxID=3391146 RepID=UPI0039E95C72
MNTIVKLLQKLKGVHVGLFIAGVIAVVYLFVNVEKERVEHLKNGGILACGEEDKTEIIDEGYRISPSGLALLSKTGKKWNIKQCTPFSVIDTKQYSN